MQKNNDIVNLYVGCVLKDDFVVNEEYVHYETLGNVSHNIKVFPKRVLLYSKYDQKGQEVFYDAKTNEKIKHIYSDYELHSYESNSNEDIEVAERYKNKLLWLKRDIRSRERWRKKLEKTDPPYAKHEQERINSLVSLLNRVEYYTNGFCLIMPFNDYCEQLLGKSFENISLSKAQSILNLINLKKSNKPITLSYNPEEAQEQLKTMGYDVQSSKKTR